MSLLKNRACIAEMLSSAVVLLVSAVICWFTAPDAVFVILIAGAVLLTVRWCFAAHRNRQIMNLTEQIEHLLRCTEDMIPAAYEEGELSLLRTAVLKMARGFQEQNLALRSDHLYLKQSLENLSHQLRTPMTAMTLLLGLLRKPELSPQQQRQYLQELTSLLSRMEWQIDMLLRLSSLEAGVIRLEEKPVDCRSLIAAACEPVSVSAEIKGIEIRSTISENAQFCGDFQHSAEALMNLLKNSVEHTPEGGCITVTAEENALCTVITVTDSGCGIPEKDLPHLFERFYRSEGGTHTGFGIGLAYAKEIITRQNGTVEAHSAADGGAEFVIRIYRSAV